MRWPDLQPGDYAVAITTEANADTVGFQARREGLEVRDVLSVQLPSSVVYMAFLLRRDPEASIVERVVTDGTGALDIDESRISTDETLSGGGGKLWSHYRDSTEDRAEPQVNRGQGRFPSNLLLVHGSGCKQVGTRKIRSGTHAYEESTAIENQVYNTGWGKRPSDVNIGYTDDEGNETIPDWNCQPTCPIHGVDTQSGNIKVPETYVKATSTYNRIAYGKGIGLAAGSVVNGYGDEGGASRFFKQVTSLDELIAYLQNMIRCKHVLTEVPL